MQAPEAWPILMKHKNTLYIRISEFRGSASEAKKWDNKIVRIEIDWKPNDPQ